MRTAFDDLSRDRDRGFLRNLLDDRGTPAAEQHEDRRPQDRPDVQGDAGFLADRRARLWLYLRWIGAAFYRSSQIDETGLAAGVLGHPAMAIAWLADKLPPFGVTLEPGHMMLPSAFTRPVWAEKGDTLNADFGPLGSVAVQLV